MKSTDYMFLGAAFLAFVLSVSLWFSGQKDSGLFVGIWVPSLLSAANYIKNLTREKS